MNNRPGSSARVYFFLGLACLLTWVLAAPTAMAWLRHENPSGLAMACAGLSAFGPLVAALVFWIREGRPGSIFGPWRTHIGWVVLALLAPLVIRTLAVAAYALVGGNPSQWFYPPSAPEQVAALVLFPIAEEFGWRGYAHPRLMQRHGFVKGSLLLGAMWGLWHLGYSVTPEAAAFDVTGFALGMLELPLYTLILTWIFERAGRSMATALAFHAAAHLNHLEVAPRSEVGLHVAHLVVVALGAGWAAWALMQKTAQPVETSR